MADYIMNNFSKLYIMKINSATIQFVYFRL